MNQSYYENYHIITTSGLIDTGKAILIGSDPMRGRKGYAALACGAIFGSLPPAFQIHCLKHDDAADMEVAQREMEL